MVQYRTPTEYDSDVTNGRSEERLMMDARASLVDAISDYAVLDERLVVVAGSERLREFARLTSEYAEQTVNVRADDARMADVLMSIASSGRIPIVVDEALALMQHGYGAMREVGSEALNVKFVGVHAGVVNAARGAYAVVADDYGLARLALGYAVLSPQGPTEARDAAVAMVNHPGPVYLRLGSEAAGDLAPSRGFTIGAGLHLREGDDVTILATGAVTAEALRAVDWLAADGVSADVIGLPTVQPLDVALIASSAARTGRVVTIEEHYTHGGLASAVADSLGPLGIRIEAIGVPHLPAATPVDMPSPLAAFGLDAQGIYWKLRVRVLGF